jgi:hypothetical protein
VPFRPVSASEICPNGCLDKDPCRKKRKAVIRRTTGQRCRRHFTPDAMLKTGHAALKTRRCNVYLSTAAARNACRCTMHSRGICAKSPRRRAQALPNETTPWPMPASSARQLHLGYTDPRSHRRIPRHAPWHRQAPGTIGLKLALLSYL